MTAGDPVEVENSCFLLTETSKYLLDTFKGVAEGFIGAAIGGGDEGGGVASEAETHCSPLGSLREGFTWINFPVIEKGSITTSRLCDSFQQLLIQAV